MLDDVRRTLAGADHMPITDQLAVRCRTALVDLAVVDGQLVGRDRERIGYLVPVTGTWLEEWARLHVPQWTRPGMTTARWNTVCELLTAWVVARDAADAAAVPPHQRRVQQLDAQRRLDERRAELQAERDRADAELAALAGAGQTARAETFQNTVGRPSGPVAGLLRRRPSS